MTKRADELKRSRMNDAIVRPDRILSHLDFLAWHDSLIKLTSPYLNLGEIQFRLNSGIKICRKKKRAKNV